MVLYDINSAEGVTGKKIFDDFLILISLICFQNVHFLLRFLPRRGTITAESRRATKLMKLNTKTTPLLSRAF